MKAEIDHASLDQIINVLRGHSIEDFRKHIDTYFEENETCSL